MEHLALRQPPRKPQPIEGPPGLLCLPAYPDASGEIGVQRGSARQKGEKIHIPVTAAVGPVHQTRLGCRGDLIEQRLRGKPGGIIAVRRVLRLGQKRPRLFLQRGNRVRAASCADLCRASANQACPPVPPQLLPVNLLAVGAQHIHIKQPARRGLILDVCGDGLHGKRICIDQKDCLVPGFFLLFLEIDDGHASRLQLLAQKPFAQCKASAYQAAVLDWPCDIHGEANHRLSICAQQLPLPCRPLLSSQEHFFQ